MTAKKSAKDLNSYGDTRGTNIYWRDPNEPTNFTWPTNGNRSGSLPNILPNKQRQKAMDIYDKSMEPTYGDTKTIIKEVVIYKDPPVQQAESNVKEQTSAGGKSKHKSSGYKYDFFSAEPSPNRPESTSEVSQAVPINIIRKSPSTSLKPPERENSDIATRYQRPAVEPKFRETNRTATYRMPHAKTTEDLGSMQPNVELSLDEFPVPKSKKSTEPIFRERNQPELRGICVRAESPLLPVPKVISPPPPPRLPQIFPQPTQTKPLRDEPDEDHSDFYRWLFNGHHDMNRSKLLLFQNQFTT